MASSSVPVGEWLRLDSDWARPSFATCRLCGRPLFGRVWSAELDGEQAVFCDPGCEALLHEYWLPRNRAPAAGDG